MNVLDNILKFLENPYFQISVIVILVIVIIFLLSEKFKDDFENDLDNFNDFRVPPHIEMLKHGQMVSNESNESNDSLNPPNYNLKNQINTPDNTHMGPGKIYRMNTGRDGYQQEQFVSIYDANFGGMLGTTLGII